MARATNILIAVLCVLPVGARAALPPSEVIFPAQKLPIKFSHKQHLGFKLRETNVYRYEFGGE